MKSNQKSDLMTRVWTALLFGVVSLGLIIFSDYTQVLFLFLVAILSGYEYLKMTNQDNWVSILLPISIFLLSTSFFSRPDYAYEYYFVGICIVYCIIALAALKCKELMVIHKKANIALAAIAIVLPLSLTASYILKGQNENHYFLLIIILLIWSSDTFAYLFGRKIGKNKLWPSISPNKTIEGFLAAGVCTALLGGSIGYFINDSVINYLILGLMIWFTGSFGDLVQSSVKRYFNAKDSGSFLPGHGGFWDRFDSFIFVLPFILLLQYIF